MNFESGGWKHLQKLVWEDVLVILGVLVAAHLLIVVAQRLLRHTAERARPGLRLSILRAIPLVRLLIRLAALAVIVPIVIEPTVRNVVTLLAGVALALAYVLKDYGSSVVAGLVTVLENTYQPGDWIEVDGAYGEVKSIGARALQLVTPDDTTVIIPHSRLWSASIYNASSGSHSLLCVADFYLHPDHDGFAVRQRLAEIAEANRYRLPDSPVKVIVTEKPWGTHYKLKAYVKESREQFFFTTELTLQSKEALRALHVQFAQAMWAEARR
ncbi:MAG: mechanosensitive ion channel family protein [Acidobacteriia bacterium]|nr:mechanosensitive ion channel family protein [Terriglobia bacterium]